MVRRLFGGCSERSLELLAGLEYVDKAGIAP